MVSVMSWESEKNIYIKKLEGIIDGIDRIFRLEGNHIITDEMKFLLKRYEGQAKQLLPKLKNDEFEIAVVGLEKAGKSSFSNALIGLSALPTADERCTYTSTCIRFASENYAEVYFHTQEDFDLDFQNKLSTLEIPNAQNYTIRNLSLEKYKQLFEGCSEDTKRLYEESIHQDILKTLMYKEQLLKYINAPSRHYEENMLDSSDFKGFITKPEKAIAVKDVIIYSKNLKNMRNAILYDVPGFNSPTELHQKQTRQKMNDADAIVMVANAKAPSLTSDALKIFKESDQDGTCFHDKLFVFANKADTVANLEQNKKTTYDEWIYNRSILPEEYKKRIVFGSANACLYDLIYNKQESIRNDREIDEQQEELKIAYDAVQRKGIPDGINLMHTMLEDYYKNDRFSILKKRIEKILYDVEDVFKEQNLESTTGDWNKEYAKISLNLRDRLNKTLKKELQQLRTKVNESARKEQPLTKSISESVKNLITTENYSITDEEIDEIGKEIAGINNDAVQPAKLDAKIRENRFIEMYDAFCKKLFQCTSSKHHKVTEQILKIFLSAMKVEEQSQYYDVLKKNIMSFCNIAEMKQKGPQEIQDPYYQSLIDRFARDLFEVQIKFALADRLNKFRAEAQNFFSLSVFYYWSQNKEDTDYQNFTMEECPMWKLILYPDQISTLSSGISMQRVKTEFQKLTGISLDTNNDILNSLERLFQINGNNILNVLNKAFLAQDLSKKLPHIAINQATDILRELLGSAATVLEGERTPKKYLLNNILTSGEFYKEDLAKKQKFYDYNMVQKEFDDDIRALCLILENAFIPAVNMDKAFSARESKFIEDIIYDIDTEKFNDFISENCSRIAYTDYQDLEDRQQEQKLNLAVKEQIKNILKEIKSVSTND